VNPAPGAVRSAGLSLNVTELRVAFAERDGTQRTVLDVPAFTVAGLAQVALCGPSGSGKTTFLDVLAGLQRPQHGRVAWSAVELTVQGERALARWRRETVGLVFQQFHLFPGLTALENVLLPLRFAHWSVDGARRRQALDLLRRVGVDAGAGLARMSRGEQQRVAVARALVTGPAIVLADEPTASLDRDTGRAVADLLCELCRESAATLIVATHDPALAERLDQIHEIADRHLRPRPRRGVVVSMASVA
jgi:putative ABC transport system ATP-binding protein